MRFWFYLVWLYSIPLYSFKFANIGWQRKFGFGLQAIQSTSAVDSFIYNPSNIRNFCIIAHIDHGKSTLADRLLEFTKTVEARNMQEQLLDNLSVERERGITIKLQAARMQYRAKNGELYLLNLIDTPGHVDFGYEVSRSLAACEGAILVVDATQGVEAQTLANVQLAAENNLEIVTVINKIDLGTADPERVINEIEQTIGLECKETAVLCSAKTGQGIEDVLEAIIHQLPSPKVKENESKRLRGLIFDSYYDTHRGVVVFFRVVDGEARKGERIRFLNSKAEYEILELGVMIPPLQQKTEVLRAGEVGYIIAGVKNIEDARVGDTIASVKSWQSTIPLSGYEPAKQMVYAGLYPTDSNSYKDLTNAIEKLKLNDAALSYEPESSEAMGLGFRCGFLGLLHMDITQERLESEYDLDLVITAPSVVYKVILKNEEEKFVHTPSMLPDFSTIKEIQEPYVRLEMITPSEYIGGLMNLAETRRGNYIETRFLNPTRSALVYELPLSEVITDFYDKLKSRSAGYASMSFQDIGYRTEKLVKMDIKVNGVEAAPLSTIVHRDKAHAVGEKICEKLKELIPRQHIKIQIQAYIGGKSVASSQLSAVSKDVLAKCYGGDFTRKLKLLDKQARGKKRMKEIGTVNIPQEAFMAVVKIND